MQAGKETIFCFLFFSLSHSTTYFCISFLHPSLFHVNLVMRMGTTFLLISIHTRDSSLEAEFCALVISVIPPFHTIHDHTDLDLITLEYFYLLIITDTVFTFGLKEQRPFPDSHLESILKICSCNVNLYVTSHFRNHQM